MYICYLVVHKSAMVIYMCNEFIKNELGCSVQVKAKHSFCSMSSCLSLR